MLGIGQSGKSWQTTFFGVLTILCGAAVVVGAFIVPTVAVIAIPAGLGFMTAGMVGLKAKDVGVTGVPNAQNPKDMAVTPEKKIDIPIKTQ
jgi:predicted phage tail protein